MNNLCEPSALNHIPLHCISYSGYRLNNDKEKALSWHIRRCSQTRVSLENNVRDACYFRNAQPPLSIFYSTTSTGAVPLWVSFLLLGQMKTSWSFVATAFLHSLNQPKAFCSACGVASVPACFSPPLHRLLCSQVFWSHAKKLHNFWQDLRPFHPEQYILLKISGERLLQVIWGDATSGFTQTRGR